MRGFENGVNFLMSGMSGAFDGDYHIVKRIWVMDPHQAFQADGIKVKEIELDVNKLQDNINKFINKGASKMSRKEMISAINNELMIFEEHQDELEHIKRS